MKTISQSHPGCPPPDLSGYVPMPSDHTAGVTNLVGIAGDGVTPVFVPTSSVWQGCLVYRATSAQTLTASATTTVIFNAETRDTLGLYDTSTGYFRPNKTGLWRLTASASCTASGAPNTAGAAYNLLLRRVSDAAEIAHLCADRTSVSTTSIAPLSNGSSVVELVSGTDYEVSFLNGDTKNWSMNALQARSFFVAEFVAE